MLKHDPNEILYAVSNLTRAALLSGVVIGGLGPSASAADRKADTYLAVWASDKKTDDNHLAGFSDDHRCGPEVAQIRKGRQHCGTGVGARCQPPR